GAVAHLLALRAAHAFDPAVGEHLRANRGVPFVMAVGDGTTFETAEVAGDDVLLVMAEAVGPRPEAGGADGQ
ncbi:MAG: hypothetical protein ACRDY5_07565, partial [Acidimicrobiales bacterium]